MSTAVMHTTTSIYDFGDVVMKNQPSSLSLLQQQQQQQSQQQSGQTQQQDINNTPLNINGLNADAVQQQLFNQQQHQQEQHQKVIKHVLSRAVSQPPNSNNVVTWVNTLIENLGNVGAANAVVGASNPNIANIAGHRKLERTQSEPAPQQQQQGTSRYKTELCRPFEEAGECKYGEKCQFAHGAHELRSLSRHPKYKTEFCRTYHSVGFCPYGPRCHFVHNQDEANQHNARIAAAAVAIAAQRNASALTLNNAAASLTINNAAAYTRLASSLTVAAAAVAQQQIQQQQQQQSRQQLNLNNLTNLTNGNNLLQQQHNQHNQQHQLPISPPLSMSTGSDRASPTGSLSPTNSISAFPFIDQISPNNQNQLLQSQQQFSFNSPPSSPAQTPSPPPQPIIQQQQQHQQHKILKNNHRILTKQQSLNHIRSSPIAMVTNNNNSNGSVGSVGSSAMSSIGGSPIDEARLPVFNRLSKTIDAFNSFNI